MSLEASDIQVTEDKDNSGCIKGYNLKWNVTITWGQCPGADYVEIFPDYNSQLNDPPLDKIEGSGSGGSTTYQREKYVECSKDTDSFEFTEEPQLSFMSKKSTVTKRSILLRDNDTFQTLSVQVASVGNGQLVADDGSGIEVYDLNAFDQETQNRLNDLQQNINNGNEEMESKGTLIGDPCYPTATVKTDLGTECCTSTTPGPTTPSPCGDCEPDSPGTDGEPTTTSTTTSTTTLPTGIS